MSFHIPACQAGRPIAIGFAAVARPMPAVWGLVLVILALLSGVALAGEDAVQDGRDALTSGGFDWYDSATDDLRRVQVEPPAQPSNWGSNNVGAATSLAELLAGIGQLLIWLLVAVALSGLVWLLIRYYLNREAGTATKARSSAVAEIDRTEALPIPLESDIGDLLAAARKAYEEGNYRLAIVYLYSHELVELDKHQVIHLAKGKTNRQYLREVLRAGKGALGTLLEQTQIVFEEAFFGGHPISVAQFEPCWAALGEFNRLVREGAR